MYYLPGEAGNDAQNIKLTAINKQISDEWKTLSAAQREAITAEPIQQIEEQRENKKLVAHSIPLNAFHDARSTIRSIETQVSGPWFADLQILMLSQLKQLYSRTGLEFLLVACRSTVADFAKPFAYFSSATIKEFFSSLLNRSIDDFALQLEAYVMSGIKGMSYICVLDYHITGSLQASSKIPRHRHWSLKRRQRR